MRICAGATLVKNSAVLLGLRSGLSELYPDTWDVIGGHCEAGETIEETLVRELKEELGIHPVRYEKLGTITEQNPQKYGEAQYYIFAIYEWEGEPKNLGDEHQSIQWFNGNELQAINLASTRYLELFSRIDWGT